MYHLLTFHDYIFFKAKRKTIIFAMTNFLEKYLC